MSAIIATDPFAGTHHKMLSKYIFSEKCKALGFVTVIAAVFGSVVVAQEGAGPVSVYEHIGQNVVGTSWLVGQMVWAGDATQGDPAKWHEAGRVDDVLIGLDHKTLGYSIDMGGFLGFGAYKVLLVPEKLEFVDVSGETYLVTNLTEDQLQNLPQLRESENL